MKSTRCSRWITSNANKKQTYDCGCKKTNVESIHINYGKSSKSVNRQNCENNGESKRPKKVCRCGPSEKLNATKIELKLTKYSWDRGPRWAPNGGGHIFVSLLVIFDFVLYAFWFAFKTAISWILKLLAGCWVIRHKLLEINNNIPSISKILRFASVYSTV